jgi:hypothetical protein
VVIVARDRGIGRRRIDAGVAVPAAADVVEDAVDSWLWGAFESPTASCPIRTTVLFQNLTPGALSHCKPWAMSRKTLFLKAGYSPNR